MTKPKLVYVQWVDSCCGSGWQTLERIRAACTKCITVGFLVHEDDECISVATTLGYHEGEPNQTADAITIPRVAIVAWWDLEGAHD